MDFETLQRRLLTRLRSCVQNGDLTERGLARMIGISQPHMHHILKGVRGLSVEKADRILRTLDMSIVDLLDADLFRIPPRKVRSMVGERTKIGGFVAIACGEGWEFATVSGGRGPREAGTHF
jgi:transcriptional regulator with XRE-family HTH domain